MAKGQSTGTGLGKDNGKDGNMGTSGMGSSDHHAVVNEEPSGSRYLASLLPQAMGGPTTVGIENSIGVSRNQ